ncbi:hypothetical protein LY78DRAFT_697266 [Colletotrichum sublineola]|nr:hypothetical protein LY78DRAFT_697266 [Colletotrichum sublineola]
MPPTTRSQTKSLSSSSSSPDSQTRYSRSGSRSRSRSRSSNGSIDSADADYTLVPHATQLNLPLVLPPPVGRQLLSLCFHSSWRARRHLRVHFVSTDVLLDDAPDSPDLSEPESDPEHDPEHHHDFLTIVNYDPIAVSLPSTASPWALPAAAALFLVLLVLAALVLLAVDSFASIRPYTCPLLRNRRECLVPFSADSSASNHYTVTTSKTKAATATASSSTSSSTTITLRNLTAVVRPYAQLVRLLDHPNAVVLPAIQREFSELCLTAWALPHIESEPCYRIVDLLDKANVHLSQLLVGIHTRGPGNPISALSDTIVLMAYGVYQRQQQQQHQGHFGGDADHDTNGDGSSSSGGVWNRTAEGVFHAVISQVPNWLDDHNALALPLQTVLESLHEARSLEDGVSAVFKSAISDADPKTFPAEDVLYALDHLFDPLLARRDTLLHTLKSAIGRLDEAAQQMYTFNSTLYELRGEALAGKKPRRFEDFDALLSRLAYAVRVLSHEIEAVGVRERRGGTRRLEDERAALEAVEESRPRHRRARERASVREREQSRWLWW